MRGLPVLIVMVAGAMIFMLAFESAAAAPPSQQGEAAPPSSPRDKPNSPAKPPSTRAPHAGAKDGKASGRDAGYDKIVPLEFTLMDAYGREVRADDYRGVPVLISTGACWCGGCQGDAEELRRIESKYRARGLQVIRSVTYDNELPAWEFQKHYRLPYVQLLDPSREFEKHYNNDGWPFIMLADGEGNVTFRKNMTDWQELTKLIESVLPGRSPVQTIQREGISYLPETVKRSGETEQLRQVDRFPSLACAEDGRAYVAFTTNRNGTQDVYLRVFDGGEWLPDRPIAATKADEFDGTVIVDQENRPWVSWTSNAAGPQYNVFVRCAAESSTKGAATQVTHSDLKNGVMHARMTVDAKGRIWVTYYQWEWIFGRSRDKEVYTRYLDEDRWSKEIHVSPEDILPADDHTDPVIAPFGNGVVIGWSWDFHHVPQNQGYSQVPQEPSIFLRQVEPGPKLERARAVSGPNVDTRPTIAIGPDGRVFCAWESVLLGRHADAPKMIAATVEDLQHKEQPAVGANISGFQNNVCTPCLAVSPNGSAAIVWAELAQNGHWTLKQALWNSKKNVWTSPKTLVSKGKPRFPSAAYAKDGKLWIAYCANKGDRREVVVLRGVGDAR